MIVISPSFRRRVILAMNVRSHLATTPWWRIMRRRRLRRALHEAMSDILVLLLAELEEEEENIDREYPNFGSLGDGPSFGNGSL